MNKLENRILEAWEEKKEFYINSVKKIETDRKTISMVISIDNVFDEVIYNIKEDSFKIQYSVGKGKGLSLCMNNKSALYDEVEYRELEL